MIHNKGLALADFILSADSLIVHRDGILISLELGLSLMSALENGSGSARADAPDIALVLDDNTLILGRDLSQFCNRYALLVEDWIRSDHQSNNHSLTT